MNKPLTYDQYGNLAGQHAFLERYSVLVKRIAHHLMARLPASVQVEDLIQAGMIGLLEAQKNYDGTKGASFETYAGIRIRGAMLDDIRRGDWVPRSVHRNNREIGQAIATLEGELNREPTDGEVASYLEITLDQYHAMLNDINCSRVVGIDDLGVSEDVISPVGLIDDDSPFKGVADESFRIALVTSIKSLPEREALVLSLYYDEELNLKENTQEADDGVTALPMLKNGEFDFVVTDWNMPGMQGIDLLRNIRADANLKHLPVLMITAEAKREQIIEAAQAGVNGYIVKPFTAATLKEKLDKIFERL